MHPEKKSQYHHCCTVFIENDVVPQVGRQLEALSTRDLQKTITEISRRIMISVESLRGSESISMDFSERSRSIAIENRLRQLSSKREAEAHFSSSRFFPESKAILNYTAVGDTGATFLGLWLS